MVVVVVVSLFAQVSILSVGTPCPRPVWTFSRRRIAARLGPLRQRRGLQVGVFRCLPWAAFHGCREGCGGGAWA